MTWSLIFQKNKLLKTDCSEENELLSEGTSIDTSQETVEQNIEEK